MEPTRRDELAGLTPRGSSRTLGRLARETETAPPVEIVQVSARKRMGSMVRVGRKVVTLIAVLLAVRSAVSMGASTDHFFDSAGLQIHYIEDGTGEPVVLVHGFLGSIESWTRLGVFGELAKSYRVIALDSRGHGKSAKPHSPQQYEREMGLDIVRLLDHLNIERAHIIGYSLGALIVAQLATARPDRFLSATLGGHVR